MSEKDLEKLLRTLRSRIGESLGPSGSPCPPADALQAFREGRLPGEQAKEIAHHLLSCDVCGRAVTAWDAVEAEDRGAEARTGARRRFFRPTLALAGSIAAAAIVAYLVIPAFLVEPTFTADFAAVGGGLRSAALHPDQAIEFRLSMPSPGYACIVSLDRTAAELVYPEDGTGERLSGEVTLPGGGNAWRLKDFALGENAFLVCYRDRPFAPEDLARLLAALRSTADHLSEDQVRRAVEPALGTAARDAKFLRFTVQP